MNENINSIFNSDKGYNTDWMLKFRINGTNKYLALTL